MRQVLVLAVVIIAASGSTARAAFDSCVVTGTTLTATFGAGTTAVLDRAFDGTIRADGAPCGSVTTIDRIVVAGDGSSETLFLEQSGGPFAPGATSEGTSSDEIEIDVDLGPSGLNTLNVLGTTGADRIVSGRASSDPFAPRLINLNAGESDGADVDVTLREGGVIVRGGDGPDVLADGGGVGIPTGGSATLEGGVGNDDVGPAERVIAGRGDDTFRLDGGTLSFSGATGPITLALPGAAGGETAFGLDGFAGTDTLVGTPTAIELGRFDDRLTASGLPSFFSVGGAGGNDVLEVADTPGGFAGDAGNDVLRVTGGAKFDLGGGPGNDELRAGGGDDAIDGGPGRDIVDGGAGDDVLEEDSEGQAPAADVLIGGPGRDRVSYSGVFICRTPTTAVTLYFAQRRAAVRADLEGDADDGAPGEGDTIGADVEGLSGTPLDDVLTGDARANVLSGFGGADVLRGGEGDDRLEGLREPCPGFPSDTVTQIGDAGDDLDGGPGADVVNADLGDDVVAARDGATDTVDCGPGTDKLTADPFDPFTACEDVAAQPGGPPTTGESPATPATPATPSGPAAPSGSAAPAVVRPPAAAPRPAAAPTVASLVDRPTATRCVSRRRLTLRVKRSVVSRVRSVTVVVAGKRKARVTGRRLGLPVNLTGLPKGRFTVRLEIVLADGRAARDTRRYRTCAPKRGR